MGNSLSKLNKIVKYDAGYIYNVTYQNQVKYVGSSVDFKDRLRRHKNDCYNVDGSKYNTPLYEFIRSNGDWVDYEFKIIDVYYTITKKLLTKIEGDYIRHFDINELFNLRIEGRTRKEYYQDNLIEIKAKDVNRYKNNKVVISLRRKKYYEKNKEDVLKKVSDYQRDNKDKIKAKKSKPWTCDICDKTITISCKARHLKGPTHIKKAQLI